MAKINSQNVINQFDKKTEKNTPVTMLNNELKGVLMPTIKIKTYEYIGKLKIKSLNINLPVMAEWDYERLKIAPCRYSGSIYDNNLIIAAHNYKSHFGALSQVNLGDYVEFIDAYGVIHAFEVLNIEVLQAEEIEKLLDNNKNEWDLTLFTCTMSGKSRYVIRCEQVIY
ncbi:sortase [Anaerosphaera multitolerans]|nr:sortase [Anaerosphaera multitolerans]